jgi:2-keto-3-deoxy-L-rhamnonate aldolase RhmA
MARDSLKEKLDAGESAFGVICFDPYSIDVAAHVGFDWIFIDLMFTALDWTATELLIRCCEGNGITPVIRVQSNPWLGYDHNIAVDVTRLISIGAKYIVISNSCKKEIEECVEAARNWHQRYWVHPTGNAWGQAAREEGLSGIQIIPQPECKQGLAELEDTLKIPSINIAMIGATDPSMALSGSKTPNFYAKELWDFIGRMARVNDTVMITNTSWFKTMDDMAERVAHMRQFGVRMPLLQTSYYFFQLAAQKALAEMRSVLK